MVIYDLRCGNRHSFEGWFSNRDDFLGQLERGIIRCPLCDDATIEERPSAPAVHVGKRTRKLDAEKRQAQALARPAAPRLPAPRPPEQSSSPSNDAAPEPPAATPLRALVEVMRTVIEEHFEDVGSGFADEAVAIYLGDAEERPIRGTTTPEESAELTELGIPFATVPLPRFDD
jgi:hypothetical protein